ncbi:MAG TPA: hypothetical protein HA283_04570 [Nanoarchaeota archaeon]|nr:hypothetical protein [Nanoarchaeota archaeon]HIH63542.1 hypothetical protein [Nanoarchaeota archaeon]
MEEKNILMASALFIIVLVLGGFLVYNTFLKTDKTQAINDEINANILEDKEINVGEITIPESFDSAEVSTQVDEVLLEENQELELGEMMNLP